MSMLGLQGSYDSGIKLAGQHSVTLPVHTATGYCFQAAGRDAATTFHFSGPGGEVTAGNCP